MHNAAVSVLEASAVSDQIADIVIEELAHLPSADALGAEPLAELTCIPDKQSGAHLYALTAAESKPREYSAEQRAMLDAARRTCQHHPDASDTATQAVLRDIDDLFLQGALGEDPLVPCACMLYQPNGHTYLRTGR